MSGVSIRTRVLAVFLLLVVLGIVEATLVLYVQREAERALVHAERTHDILRGHDEIRRAVAAMQSAQRGFLITGAETEIQQYNLQYGRYRRVAASTPSLIEDSEQRTRFDRIRLLVEDWHNNGSMALISGRRRGDDVMPLIATLAAPRFARASDELDAFERRQIALSDEAAATARGHIRGATVALTTVPVATIALMIGLLFVTSRGILQPLAALAASARRVAAGDYEAPLPAATGNEIAPLVRAFADMRHAVQERARETAAAYHQVRRAHADLEAVIETVPAALIIVNRDASLRLQNRAAEHLLGKPPEGGDAARYWRSFVYRDSSGKVLQFEDLPAIRAFKGADVLGEELQVHRPGHPPVTIMISASPLRNEEGKVTAVAAGFLDITRLRELDRMKDEFVSVVSHELRTPLTAIRGSLQLLLADPESVPDPENRQLLEVALNSCERLVRIINDILDIAKMEAGQLKLQPRPLSVADVAQQSIESVQQLASQAGVHFVVDVAETLPPAMADNDRLTQALVNLLSNAVKFAPPGSVVIIAAREEAGYIVLSVRDQGPGIAPEDRSQLFQKFHQLDSSGSRRASGTGLGLAITKAIVEEHGGEISVESAVGQGTTFTLKIPRAESPIEETVSEPLSAPSTGDTSQRTVLIVDDDEDMRAMLRRAMELGGLRVLEAGTGRAAIEHARRERPDAITLDLEMPGGDGWWVIDKLRDDPTTGQIPVLVLTATDTDVSATPHPIVRKPFDTADLLADVSRLVQRRRGRTVLVAEDDAEVRHVLREALQRKGLKVIEAADGRQALKLAESGEMFDLVVLDLQMPYAHGHDIIRALRQRERRRGVPIIVLSGSVGERQAMESLVLGASIFMMKPPDAFALAREVERLLNN